MSMIPGHQLWTSASVSGIWFDCCVCSMGKSWYRCNHGQYLN